MNSRELDNIIENLKSELNDSIEINGRTAAVTIEKSQELDRFLNIYERSKLSLLKS